MRGYQESIQLSGAYATRQTSWRTQRRRGQWAEPNRLSEGVTQGQHRDSPVEHQGMPRRRRGRECGVWGTAWARRRHAVERDHMARRQPISRHTLSFGASPNREFTVHVGMYGKVCLRRCRRLHRASARHTDYQGLQEFVSEVNVR
jgi:hypothetical protein